MTEQVSAEADKVLADLSREADNPLVIDPHPDRTREGRTPGFSRLRTDWDGPDANVIQGVMEIISDRIMQNFSGAYQIMNEVYDIIREAKVDDRGRAKRDRYGWTIWKRNSYGGYIEDFSRLSLKEREDFYLRITMGLFEWTQRAADIWAEAMFGKAQWEESMAISFTSPEGRMTIEDRTQQGRLGSRDERYHAVFLSAYSRKADGVVRSLELISQRLKDSLA